MTMSASDRAALEEAVAQLTAVSQELRRRAFSAPSLTEREQAALQLHVLNPDLLSMCQRLNDLKAAVVDIAPPSANDQAAIATALRALSRRVAADQQWEAFVLLANTALDSARTIQSNLEARTA
jgi:hypothetical protein